jgi:hypothetical protein
MIRIRDDLSPRDLLPAIGRMWALSGEKIERIERNFDPALGAPVFTVEGRYTARGWTEWTQGFQYGSAILQYDATGEGRFLEIGRAGTLERLAGHVTHTGVHDHGFNNLSTYGNLLRLLREGRIEHDPWQRRFYELALRCSGAVQAARWSPAAPLAGTDEPLGYIHSFNGPQSLFIDTLRSLRVLAVAHRLGHVLMGEGDERISLLGRLLTHAWTTAAYLVWARGDGAAPTGCGDAWDVRGRVCHEAVFNTADGRFRCLSSQQGYSPRTTWTRGLAWAMLGFAEQLEFLSMLGEEQFLPPASPPGWSKRRAVDLCRRCAIDTCDFYIEQTPSCGVPYWDTGAPGLARLGDYLDRSAEPCNEHEPVDSSAACIAAQGLVRLGRQLGPDGAGRRYVQAGLTVLSTLLGAPYLSEDVEHEGLILHSVYHRPNGWDRIPPGRSVPCDESSMWGDYHAREAALLVERLAEDGPYLTFYGACGPDEETR